MEELGKGLLSLEASGTEARKVHAPDVAAEAATHKDWPIRPTRQQYPEGNNDPCSTHWEHCNARTIAAIFALLTPAKKSS
jgi:hypothetical protein